MIFKSSCKTSEESEVSRGPQFIFDLRPQEGLSWPSWCLQVVCSRHWALCQLAKPQNIWLNKLSATWKLPLASWPRGLAVLILQQWRCSWIAWRLILKACSENRWDCNTVDRQDENIRDCSQTDLYSSPPTAAPLSHRSLGVMLLMVWVPEITTWILKCDFVKRERRRTVKVHLCSIYH